MGGGPSPARTGAPADPGDELHGHFPVPARHWGLSRTIEARRSGLGSQLVCLELDGPESARGRPPTPRATGSDASVSRRTFTLPPNGSPELMISSALVGQEVKTTLRFDGRILEGVALLEMRFHQIFREARA